MVVSIPPFLHGIAEDAGALADYQADSANLALTQDILGLGSVTENDEGKT